LEYTTKEKNIFKFKIHVLNFKLVKCNVYIYGFVYWICKSKPIHLKRNRN